MTAEMPPSSWTPIRPCRCCHCRQHRGAPEAYQPALTQAGKQGLFPRAKSDRMRHVYIFGGKSGKNTVIVPDF